MSRLPHIHYDEDEYMKIAKGRARKDLAKYLRRGTIPAGIRGKKVITIPVDWIEIPSFRYGFPPVGVGEGDGNPGDDLGSAEESDEEGEEKGAGQGGGGHSVEITFTEDEFADLFVEALELPRIQPKGDRSIKEDREKYNTVSRIGPRSQIHMDRSFEEALKAAIATGSFNPPEQMDVILDPKNFWYKSYSVIQEPKNNAVIIYMRDISGSMGLDESKAARYLCGLCGFWLARNYNGLEERYIVHDGNAWAVSEEEFFSLESGGGTLCSSAHTKAYEMIDQKFPPSEWNIYIVYMSDGFNWGADDALCVQILKEKLLPIVNQYNYGQITVKRWWYPDYEKSGSTTFSQPGTYGHVLQREFDQAENIALAEIASEPENMYGSVIDAIKKFFKKGN